MKIAIAATLGAAAENASSRRRRALVDVGAVHPWNGTAETLKQRPANRKTSPKISPMPPLQLRLSRSR